jgi:hypothetical protein
VIAALAVPVLILVVGVTADDQHRGGASVLWWLPAAPVAGHLDNLLSG